MRNEICALLILVAGAAAGCERKQTTEPVTVDHRKKVVPPTKEHLSDYVAQLPGSGQKLVAKIETPQGAITCDLYPDRAPMTVANFVGLATGQKAWKNPTNGNIESGKPFYDGLTFHRVIPGFMIQGGDPLGSGGGGPGYTFTDEVSSQDRMEVGTLAMANAGPATNGSQFFVTEVRAGLAQRQAHDLRQVQGDRDHQGDHRRPEGRREHAADADHDEGHDLEVVARAPRRAAQRS